MVVGSRPCQGLAWSLVEFSFSGCEHRESASGKVGAFGEVLADLRSAIPPCRVCSWEGGGSPDIGGYDIDVALNGGMVSSPVWG